MLIEVPVNKNKISVCVHKCTCWLIFLSRYQVKYNLAPPDLV